MEQKDKKSEFMKDHPGKSGTDQGVDQIPAMLNSGLFPDFEDIVKTLLSPKYDEWIERYKKLPSIFIKEGKHVKLLHEARLLYVKGHFYPSIIMCGVTTERIIKDILKECIYFKVNDSLEPVEDSVIEVLERIDMSNLYSILIKQGILSDQLNKKFQIMIELRNKYSHARADENDLEKDTLSALKLFEEIINETVKIKLGE